MLVAIAVMASMAFVGWLIYRAVRRRPVKAHIISYAVSCLTGIFTFAFFLTMDMPQLVKVVVSIILGVVLIFIAAYYQRRRQLSRR